MPTVQVPLQIITLELVELGRMSAETACSGGQRTFLGTRNSKVHRRTGVESAETVLSSLCRMRAGFTVALSPHSVASGATAHAQSMLPARLHSLPTVSATLKAGQLTREDRLYARRDYLYCHVLVGALSWRRRLTGGFCSSDFAALQIQCTFAVYAVDGCVLKRLWGSKWQYEEKASSDIALQARTTAASIGRFN